MLLLLALIIIAVWLGLAVNPLFWILLFLAVLVFASRGPGYYGGPGPRRYWW